MPKQTFFNLSDEKRQVIEQCALNEFEKFIYSDASINRIVKSAGIAKGSFYQYFDDKMDLAIHILTIIGNKETAYIEETLPMLEEASEDFFDWVRKQIEMSIAFGIDNMQYINVYKNLMMTNEVALHSKIAEMTTRMGVEFYTEKIQWYKDKGFLRQDIPAKVLAEYLMQLIFTFIDNAFRSVTSGDNVDFNTFSAQIDMMLDLTANGMRETRG